MRVSYEEKGWVVVVLMIDDVCTWSLDDGAALLSCPGDCCSVPGAITTPFEAVSNVNYFTLSLHPLRFELIFYLGLTIDLYSTAVVSY